MTAGHFVWTDLSTFDMGCARSDYAALFDWAFTGDATYDFASQGDLPVAAIFPMPEALAKINMPSFWMSYVRVDDLEAKVARAQTHEGVILEVAPTDFGDGARVALVRDPSGAGFTLYEGPDIAAARQPARFHHSADVSRIADFYQDLFGWQFASRGDDPWPVFDIQHPDGTRVAQAEEVPEDIRGRFSYWMPSFAVSNPDAVVERLGSLKGSVLTRLSAGRQMLADRQGAHFMIQHAGPWG